MQADREGRGRAAPNLARSGPGEVVMPPEPAVEQAAASLRLLGDPTRMKLLWVLSQGGSNVGRLAELAGATPTAVSQHLAKLRLAGLVTARRRGSHVFYSAADAHVTRLVADALDHATHDLAEPARPGPSEADPMGDTPR